MLLGIRPLLQKNSSAALPPWGDATAGTAPGSKEDPSSSQHFLHSPSGDVWTWGCSSRWGWCFLTLLSSPKVICHHPAALLASYRPHMAFRPWARNGSCPSSCSPRKARMGMAKKAGQAGKGGSEGWWWRGRRELSPAPPHSSNQSPASVINTI